MRIIHAVEDGLLVASLMTMIVLAFAQIVIRNIGVTALIWANGLLQYLVLWVGLLGAMVATREYNHINVDILGYLLKGRPKAILRAVTDLFTSAICVFLTYGSVMFLKDEKLIGDKAFGEIPTWIAEIVFPVVFGVIAIRYLIYFVLHLRAAITGGELPFKNPVEEGDK